MGEYGEQLPAEAFGGAEVHGQHQRELVPTDPRHDRVDRGGRPQPLRCRLEDMIAAGRTQPFVHDTEVVEVDQQHRALAPDAAQPRFEHSKELCPVHQSRQVIARGKLDPFLFEPRSGDAAGSHGSQGREDADVPEREKSRLAMLAVDDSDHPTVV